MSETDKPEAFTPAERIAYRIYNGGIPDLLEGMVALDLIIELKRAEAVRGFASLVRHRLERDGYLVVSDIDDSLAQFHYQEIDNSPDAA